MEDFLTNAFSLNIFVALPLFVVVRALAIIVPPIPGILIDIPAIFIFGWLPGFIFAEVGITLGAMTAFWIARKFKEPLAKRFVPLQRLHEWEKKLSENQKFWSLVAIRLPTNPLFDYISYAAGLTNISATKFFWTTLIGNAPSMFLIYYFGGTFLNQGLYYGIAFFIALLIFWFIISKSVFGKSNS